MLKLYKTMVKLYKTQRRRSEERKRGNLIACRDEMNISGP